MGNSGWGSGGGQRPSWLGAKGAWLSEREQVSYIPSEFSKAPGAWQMEKIVAEPPASVALEGERHPIAVDLPDVGAQHNPCVVALSESRLIVAVRSLKNRHTTNFMADVGEDWTLQKPVALKMKVRNELEDLRLFYWRGELWGIGATYAKDMVQQALVRISGVGIEEYYPLKSPRHEKNWMPCAGDDLRLVYSTDPLVVLHATYGGGTARVAPSVDPVPEEGGGGELRGGSQLVRVEHGWLSIVHKTYVLPVVATAQAVASSWNPMLGGWAPIPPPAVAAAPVAVYQHHFAFFDDALERVMLSKPFHFNHVGIEFCSGLTRWKDKLVASYGVTDNEAWLIEFTEDEVGRMFTRED